MKIVKSEIFDDLTVKEFIEMLKQFDQDATVCLNWGERDYHTPEICLEIADVKYTNQEAEITTGKIILIN